MEFSELNGADFEAILAFLSAAHTSADPDELAGLLVTRLAGLVRCDLISYNVIDLIGGATTTLFEPALVPRPELEQAFAGLIHEHPLVEAYARTRDPSPLRMSDHIDLAKLQSLDLYREVFAPLETNYQLAFSVAIAGDVVVGIGLNRQYTDFSDRDVAMMQVLQPHLAAAFDHATLRRSVRLAGPAAAMQDAPSVVGRPVGPTRMDILAALTPREREVADLVARGYTNRRIARTLFIAERTAEKHVANIMIKAALPSRVALALALRG